MGHKGIGALRFLLFLAVTGATLFLALHGVGADQYGSIYNIKQGLDLAGGVSITYETVKESPSDSEMEDTRYRIQKRAEEFSTESAVYLEGDNRINVDIPDATDANAILEQMGKVGSIYFIYGKGTDGVANLKLDESGEYVLARSIEEILAAGQVVLDGSDVATAEPYIDNGSSFDKYHVNLTLNEAGTTKFLKAAAYAEQYYTGTAAYMENLIAIIYDGGVESAPMVQPGISGGTVSISGQDSYAEAQQLAAIIRIGALPLELRELRSNIVGAKLGAEALRTSLLAGIIGFALVVLFMLVMYRLPGFAASLALILYTALFIIVMNLFEVTLTLPGIAGILLSIGMAVDANVIIFTRIKEELALGKTVRSSLKIGFDKARSAIIDGNVTTLLAALVLYFFGSGTIKGFAQTLGIGIVLSMLTAMLVTRFVLTALYQLGLTKESWYGMTKRQQHVLEQRKENRPFSFTTYAPRFAMVSVCLILFGIGMLIFNKVSTGNALNYSLEFMGGTSMEVVLPDGYTDNVQRELEALVSEEAGVTAEIVLVADANMAVIKTQTLDTESRSRIEERLVSDYGVDREQIETSSISGTVSGEMRRDAIVAVAISIVCMLLYIWIRFKNVHFGLSAIVALLHDALIVLAVYAAARSLISVGNTFIACMLTILGYSVNATIVVFDRIRENMAEKLNKESIADVVDRSIGQTLTRSINTSLTTLFMVIMLVILGVDTIREFAVPLAVGIVAGAYSSVTLSGAIWYWFQKHKKQEEPERG